MSLLRTLPACTLQHKSAPCSGSLTLRKRQDCVVARASELRRPELRRPEPPPPVVDAPQGKPSTDTPSASAPVINPTIALNAGLSSVVSIEYQRQRAKEMNKYFQAVNLQQEIQKSQFFGWNPANEINNGRWVMFGFSVGLLTEYATGVDFIQQLALMVSYLGIADLD